MAVGVNIYPPVLDTYMPAFLKEGENIGTKHGYKIYLSLSDYNTYEDVKNNVQVTLVRQDTNRTAFLTSAASSGIKITTLEYDEDEEQYYIVIEANDLISKELITNLYYKVQIRFTSNVDQQGNPIPQQKNPVDSNWFTEYLDCFSEWSTVCLIKGIETPSIRITGVTSGTMNCASPTLQIIGEFTYSNNPKIEKETLKSYQLTLLDIDNNIIEESEEILTNQNNKPNNFKYTFNTYLKNDGIYKVRMVYTTVNLYSNKKSPLSFDIMVHYNTDISNFVLKTIEDNENGILQVQVTLEDNSDFTKPVVLRRSSSLDNFTIWQTVHTFSQKNNKHIFSDMTVESGVIYKYYAHYMDSKGIFSAPSKITEPAMLSLEFILLTTKDKQIKVFLDGKVSSITYTVSESKTDTIGGRYPIIKKNGNLNYRTFPIEGTIHSYMDDAGLLTSKEEIYGSNLNFYNQYNEEHSVSNLKDYVYERFFREKVKEFLFADNAVLLRTPFEGNAIVKLINNNFTPNPQLGNLVYRFQTNAIEIEDCTLENLKKYSILKEEGEDKEIHPIINLKDSSVMQNNITMTIEDSIKEVKL